MAAPTVINLASFPNPSQTHRLPTVSASAALQDLEDSRSKYISTGIRGLNIILGDGFERGKVTELWGPQGAGKTALALQTAANALRSGDTVLWVDATRPLSETRVNRITAGIPQTGYSATELIGRLRPFHVPTLSHLLALILQPPPTFVSQHASLLVINGLNALVDLDYPRYQMTAPNKTEQQKWQAGRRYAILGSLVSALNKLAVLNHLAVVVTTGCSTRMRSDNGLGAALVPGIGGQEWDGGIWNRLVVFRDFSGRFVGVQRCQGKSLISRAEVGELGKLVSFEITAEGRVQERLALKPNDATITLHQKHKMTSAPKRSFDEIADSEDEDVDEYGWVDADEHALTVEGLVDQAQLTEASNPST